MKAKNSIAKEIAKDSTTVKETWSQSTRVGEYNKEVTVERLDNGGFLVTIYKSGPDKKGIYQSATKKLYSEVNPLDDNLNDDPFELIGKMFNRK